MLPTSSTERFKFSIRFPYNLHSNTKDGINTGSPKNELLQCFGKVGLIPQGPEPVQQFGSENQPPVIQQSK
jgi:hypothetical protein